MISKRYVLGNRNVYIYAGYHEWLIQVHDAVVASINGFDDYPPTGEEVADAIKARDSIVVREDNPIFACSGDELKHAIEVLNSLSDEEYSKIAYLWDKKMSYLYS